MKVLIILLVVVGVLFVIAVAMGASHGSQPTDDSSGIGFLKGLQGSRFLRLGDKSSATCAAPGDVVLNVVGSCTITFDKRGLLSTATRVALRPSNGMTVITAPRKGPVQTVSVAAGNCFGTAIDHSGGTLTLFTSGLVTLLSEACS